MKLNKPSCNICKALQKAIEAYIAKVDNDLENSMDDAGYVDSEDSVNAASDLEEEVTEILTEQTEELADVIEEAGTIPKAKKAVEEYFEDDVTGEILSATFRDYFSEAILSLSDSYMKEIEGDMAVTQLRARTTAWVNQWSNNLANLMQLTSADKMKSLLQEALDSDKGAVVFARSLIDEGIRQEAYRARTVAVTEMLRAHSVAQQEAIMQSPATDRKKWRHSGAHKNEPRPNHVAMDGQIVPKADPFVLTGRDGGTYYPMYPRDTELPPFESINCHCIHVPVTNDDVLGMSYEERKKMQEDFIAADDGEWEKELDAQNRAATGIVIGNDSIEFKNPSDVQSYRDVTIDEDDTVGIIRGGKSINAKQVTSSKNKLYISDNASRKKRTIHNIDTAISKAMDKMGISDSENLPRFVILSDEEMQKNAPSAFSPGENTVYIHEALGNKKKTKAMQLQFAESNKHESTLIHELYHWEDAEKYQKEHGKINSFDDSKAYHEWINDYAHKKIDKLTDMGYDVIGISKYAADSLAKGEFAEVYTEYRVTVSYEGE